MQKSVAETVNPGRTAAQPSPPPVGVMRRRQLVAVGLLAAALTLAYLFANWWTIGRFQITTDDAYVTARAATLAPKVAGYVAEITVADNAQVKAGDLIVRIDPGDYRLAVRAARDTADTQRAIIARIGKQTTAQRSSVDQTQAQLAAAKAAALKAAQDMKRQADLAARKINSAQALDAAQSAHEQGKATVTAAEAALAAAAGAVGVFEAQQLEAESQLRQAETAVVKAERDLSFTEVRAPFDGVIGNRGIQVGDYVQPAQRLASLVPADAISIDANFKETQLARLSPGQCVRITIDADAGRVLEGVVESLAPASGSVFSLLPPDNATGNFTKIVQRVPVRIALPPDARDAGLLRPGMSVVVSVNTLPGVACTTRAAQPGAKPAAAVASSAAAAAPRAR